MKWKMVDGRWLMDGGKENKTARRNFPYLDTVGKIVFVLLLLSLPATMVSCGGKEGDDAGEVSSGTPVQITHPGIMNMTDYLSLNGNTIFLKKEIIRATFDGFIDKVNKNIGDNVKQGDAIFLLKTKELAASDSLGLNIGDQTFKGGVYIKAGTNGVLTELDFHSGDYVAAGEQIAVVSNPSSLRIKLNVPYEDVMKVRTGGGCIINLPDGVNVPGVIERSVPSVDPVTQTQTYFIKLSRNENIPENLNVIIKFPFKEVKGATVLPKSAIMTNVTQNSFWVMKLINDSTSVRVDIKKGIENDSLAQILSPKLDTSDRIILTGAYGLPDTAQVEIEK